MSSTPAKQSSLGPGDNGVTGSTHTVAEAALCACLSHLGLSLEQADRRGLKGRKFLLVLQQTCEGPSPSFALSLFLTLQSLGLGAGGFFLRLPVAYQSNSSPPPREVGGRFPNLGTAMSQMGVRNKGKLPAASLSPRHCLPPERPDG